MLTSYSQILENLDHERRQLVRSGEVAECLPEITRLTIGDQHCIAWSSLDASNADAVIARELAHYRSLGAALEWKVYAHDTPSDLTARLATHGLTIGPREAVMLFDLRHSAAWLTHDASCRVERVARPSQLADFCRVLHDVDGTSDPAVAGELAHALAVGSEEQRGYVAYVEEEPASIGRLYTHPRSIFGGLYGGATRPAFRSRGLYRAVVAARARDAQRLGARYLLVDALPTSRPILERLGFVHVSDTWPCRFTP
jgi:hypothetical protein